MSDSKTSSRLIPQSITAYLRVRGGADAVAYYTKAFGAHERPGRLTSPEGKIVHTALTIGNSILMLSDEGPPEWHSPSPATLGGTTVSLALEVPDVDAVVDRAVAAGGTLVFPVEDQFYGMRSGRVVDPFGHAWVVSTTIEELTPDEITRRMDAWAKEHA